jgi:predicted alpha/beta superfamily hydrolase
MSPDKFGDLSPLATAIPDDDFSRGYLESLSEFMVTTLHRAIMERYCVKEDNIGIGGASMGGIASFFCGLHEMGFYKYILSYSPAFGLYEMSAFDGWLGRIEPKKKANLLPRLHIYCGGGDMLEEQLLPASRAMKNMLVQHGYDPEIIFETYDSERAHNEESWRLVLPESFCCLFDL